MTALTSHEETLHRAVLLGRAKISQSPHSLIKFALGKMQVIKLSTVTTVTISYASMSLNMNMRFYRSTIHKLERYFSYLKTYASLDKF